MGISRSRELLCVSGSLGCMKTKTRQRAFGLTNWGGKRRGAGRKPKGERAGVSHAKRPRLCARHPALVTLKLREGLPGLRYRAAHEVLLQAFAASSEGEAFRVVEYSVQTNHLHLIVEAASERALSSAMNGLASRIARALNKLWRRSGSVFTDRYHARALETPREVRNALAYVLLNARKHGSWLARRPDPYSSGPSFDGWKTPERWNGDVRERAGRQQEQPEPVQDEDADSTSRLLPEPHTWLLSRGWQRHGLLDPRERLALARSDRSSEWSIERTSHAVVLAG